MFKIISNKNNTAAEIFCDIKKIKSKELKKIKSALNNFGMIYFRRQNLTSKNYLNFAKKFGKLADYPRLKGLNKKYSKITVVQRKASDKGPSFGEQFHTDSIYTKQPPRFTMLLSKLVPKKEKLIQNLALNIWHKYLPTSLKKLKNIKKLFFRRPYFSYNKGKS